MNGHDETNPPAGDGQQQGEHYHDQRTIIRRQINRDDITKSPLTIGNLMMLGGIILAAISQSIYINNAIVAGQQRAHEETQAVATASLAIASDLKTIASDLKSDITAANSKSDSNQAAILQRIDSDEKSTAAAFQANKDTRDLLTRSRDLAQDAMNTKIADIAKREDNQESAYTELSRKVERVLTLQEALNDKLGAENPNRSK